MASIKAERWNLGDDGTLTEATLRLKYLPAWHYRVAIRRYDPGTNFRARGLAGELYVLEGDCRVQWGTDECVLQGSDFVRHPAGEYFFEVLGSGGCQVAHVWLLPPEFRVPPGPGGSV
jgi:hypothetical protein